MNKKPKHGDILHFSEGINVSKDCPYAVAFLEGGRLKLIQDDGETYGYDSYREYLPYTIEGNIFDIFKEVVNENT